MSQFDIQWQGLMENSPFSEEAIFRGNPIGELHVRGIVYSGTYTIDSPTRYATQRATRKTFLTCSLRTFSSIIDPIKVLKGLLVEVRQKMWIVKDIAGGENGNLMFELEEADNEQWQWGNIPIR